MSYASNAAATASWAARRARPRFAALTTARSDAVTMLEWMPTPQTTSPSTSASTYAAARRVLAGAHRVLVVVEHGDVDAESLGERVDERRDRAVALALDDLARLAVDRAAAR